MKLDLDAFDKLIDAATPGPWKAYSVCVRIDKNPHTLITAGIHCDINTATNDAAFIAAFNPQTVRTLIDRLRKAEAAREGWKLVPVEAETTMLERAAITACEMYGHTVTLNSMAAIWCEMLAAAPDSTPTDSADSATERKS